MLLHQNEDLFQEIVRAIANETPYTEEQIEKDYYVSLFLKELLRVADLPIVFKGGTSLSKAYQLIHRFSEDLDLAVHFDGRRLGDGKRKMLKKYIFEVSKSLGMNIKNLGSIESDRDFNQYEITYENRFINQDAILPHVLIETILVYQPYPCERKLVTNYMYEYLFEKRKMDVVDTYELHPFEATVQMIERTIIDKLFALCDYHLQNKYSRYSRHLYDIHKIWTSTMLKHDNLCMLIEPVIKDRQLNGKQNLSCLPGANPVLLLEQIIERQVYKSDYLEVTSEFITDGTTYDECISTINDIIAYGIIPNEIKNYR